MSDLMCLRDDVWTNSAVNTLKLVTVRGWPAQGSVFSRSTCGLAGSGADQTLCQTAHTLSGGD